MSKLSDFLVSLKNSSLSKKPILITQKSKLIIGLLSVLKKNFFIKFFDEILVKNNKFVKIYLKNDYKIINDVKMISKPGRRIYCSYKNLNKVIDHTFGITIISTSKGIIDHKAAKKLKLGGEIICKIL